MNAPDTLELIKKIDDGTANVQMMRPLYVQVPIGFPLPTHLDFLEKFGVVDQERSVLMPPDMCEMTVRLLKETDKSFHVLPPASKHPPESNEALIEERNMRLMRKTHL